MKILIITWVLMNKKASGSYRARMNMRGYEQQVGINVSIRVVHVLLIML